MSVGDATFSASDDFSNRLEINPCRTLWEVVCIEPNGDVKPDNFHQKPVGNVLESDLLTLWNHGSFLSRRRLAIFDRRCGSETSCPPDLGPQAW
jgi:MoaA/NifB/PqqE/SkfB family radical SAM enzyme